MSEQYRCRFCNELFEYPDDRDLHQSLCSSPGKFMTVRMYSISLSKNEDGSFTAKANTWLEEDCYVDADSCDSCFGYSVTLDQAELDWAEHFAPFAFVATLDLNKAHSETFLSRCKEKLNAYLDEEHTAITEQKRSLDEFEARDELEEKYLFGE